MKKTIVKRAVVTTDKKTGLPVIKCRRAVSPDKEMTAQRIAEMLLEQELPGEIVG